MSNLRASDLTSYCPHCSTCLDFDSSLPDPEQCGECGARRPDGGWSPLRESLYPFLGKVVAERYLIDRFLDSGAAGHVYRARARSFARHFAIKIVDTDRYGSAEKQEELTERFYLEVETMGQIKNPHVVDIYEAIELAPGILGLVMDFIDGETLDVFLEEHQSLAIADAVSIIQQLANGLQEAHRLGIIHRDIKPQNVMIETLPASGYFARLLDFGIAQVSGSVQKTYGFRGTPLYASPEQCLGATELDTRSDIYSLGCLLFHILTGQAPFQFTNALKVMDAHIESPRPRLEDATGQPFPPELESLTAHMLAREPAQRPDNLHKVYQDLTSFLRGQPMQHFGDPPPYRATEHQESGPEWQQFHEPPPGEFVSLAEHTSSELGRDPTFSEVEVLEHWETGSEVDMIRLAEFPAPFASGENLTLTAAVIDRRGMACAFADPSPEFHLMELRDGGFYFSLPTSAVIASAELDLSHGRYFLGDVRGTLYEITPGSTQARKTHLSCGSPLCMEVSASGQKLYFGTERGSLQLLDLRTRAQQEIARLPTAISAIHSPPSKPLLLALWDGSLARLSTEGSLLWHLPLAPEVLTSTGYLDDDHYFALDTRGNLFIGSAHDGTRLRTLHLGMGLRSLRRIDSGKLIGLSLFGKNIQTWELQIP